MNETSLKSDYSELSPITVEVSSDRSAFESLRNAWEALQPFPEADVDFFQLIINTRRNIIKPIVIAGYESGEVRSIIAARLEKSPFVIKAGYKALWQKDVTKVVLPYGGLIGQPPQRMLQAMLAKLIQVTRSEGAVLVDWTGVRCGSALHDELKQVSNFFCKLHLSSPTEHWMISLPPSLSDFIDQRLGKRSRQWARRCLRDFEKNLASKATLVCYTKPEEVERASCDIAKVASKTYQRGLGAGFYDDSEHRGRLKLEAAKGWLRAYVLYLNGTPCAFWVGVLVRDTFYLTYTGFDPGYRDSEVGSILFFRMIEDLMTRGVHTVDFGLGTAYYKERFCDRKFEEENILVFSPSLYGISLNVFSLCVQGPIHILRMTLQALGLVQKIKTLWRRKLLENAKAT